MFLYVDRTPPGLDAEIVSLVGVYDFARMNQVLIIYHVRSKNAAQPIVLDPNEIAAHRLVAPHRLQPWQVLLLLYWMNGRADCEKGGNIVPTGNKQYNRFVCF